MTTHCTVIVTIVIGWSWKAFIRYNPNFPSKCHITSFLLFLVNLSTRFSLVPVLIPCIHESWS